MVCAPMFGWVGRPDFHIARGLAWSHCGSLVILGLAYDSLLEKHILQMGSCKYGNTVREGNIIGVQERPFTLRLFPQQKNMFLERNTEEIDPRFAPT